LLPVFCSSCAGGYSFSYLDKTNRFKGIGEIFQAKGGRWLGAKIGLFVKQNIEKKYLK